MMLSPYSWPNLKGNWAKHCETRKTLRSGSRNARITLANKRVFGIAVNQIERNTFAHLFLTKVRI